MKNQAISIDRNLHLLFTITNHVDSLIVEDGVYSSHIDRVSQLFFLKLALVDLTLAVHLLGKLLVKLVLHLSLPVDVVLGNFLVFLWAEMSLCRVFDVILFVLLTHAIHLNLLTKDLSNRLLLLLSLHVTLHSKSTVLLLQSFQLLLIFNLTLLFAHKLHFKALPGILYHTIRVF